MIEESEEDYFLLGFNNGHDQAALRTMSYVALCSHLEDATKETTRYMLLEAEKRRRDSLPAEQPAEQPGQKPSPDHWYKKPVPVIIIAVVGGCILLTIRYLLRKHFNLYL